MTDRKYTFAEIQRIRRLCASIWHYEHDGIPHDAKDRDIAIEETARTYIAAGVDPEDLQKASDQALEALLGLQP